VKEKAFFVNEPKTKTGRNSRKEPAILFILRKSVTIPPRPFLYIDEKDEKYLFDLVRKTVHRGLGAET
jgi:phage gpG-like protein